MCWGERYYLSDELCHAGLTWMYWVEHLCRKKVWETLFQKKFLEVNTMQFSKGNMQNIMLDLVKLKDGVTRQLFCWKVSVKHCGCNMVNAQTCQSVALSWCRIDEFSWEKHELGPSPLLRLALASPHNWVIWGVKQRAHGLAVFQGHKTASVPHSQP